MQLIIAGRGGQGILLLTKILGETASHAGHPVLSSETHGMALRGGSVTTHLKVGPYRSPLVASGSADVVIGMDGGEAANHIHFLKEKGVLITNGPAGGSLNGHPWIDANQLAIQLGHLRLSNMILLGFVAFHLAHLFPLSMVKDAIARVSPGSSSEQNLRAFEAGWREAEKGPQKKKN